MEQPKPTEQPPQAEAPQVTADPGPAAAPSAPARARVRQTRQPMITREWLEAQDDDVIRLYGGTVRPRLGYSLFHPPHTNTR
jgi:hypothetical protein